MPALAALTAAQLKTAIERADALHSALLDEMIEAGRGHERPTETARLSDDLSRRFNASMQRLGELYGEKRSRMEYHGSMRPIKRLQNPGGRPRKYATAAERQAAYRAKFANVNVRMAPETAETLERLSTETLIPVTELARQMILYALANRDWRRDPRFTRPLTAQAMDDRRRATKFQPIEDDEIEGDDDA